jgi:gliding motility-associated-like protein
VVPGTYAIRHSVTSSNGCTSDTATITLKVYKLPAISAGPDLTIIAGDVIALKARADDPGYTFAWLPRENLSDPSLLQPLANPVASTSYYLYAEGEHGCAAFDTMHITVLPKLLIPNAFTPNNDGINDVWAIPGLDKYDQLVITIFNRWGQQVYQSTGYKQPWNGQYGGQPLAAGTYYYVINLGNNDPKLQGPVTILR